MLGVFYFYIVYLKKGLYICLMEKRSRHYGDITKWIEKVIDSCQTWEQTRTASRLVSNFDKQLSKEKNYRALSYSTTDILRYKIDQVRTNLIK